MGALLGFTPKAVDEASKPKPGPFSLVGGGSAFVAELAPNENRFDGAALALSVPNANVGAIGFTVLTVDVTALPPTEGVAAGLTVAAAGLPNDTCGSCGKPNSLLEMPSGALLMTDPLNPKLCAMLGLVGEGATLATAAVVAGIPKVKTAGLGEEVVGAAVAVVVTFDTALSVSSLQASLV